MNKQLDTRHSAFGTPLTRRQFLAGAGAAGALMAVQGLAPAFGQTKRPNIIFILTDDQRWDAMSCMGHPYLKTPNMDRLAKEGVRCANAFVTTALCSPSRASFLTGQYAHKHGVENNSTSLRDDAVTFPMLLQKAGYETAYFGKWHMGIQNRQQPGFDHWVSFPGQGKYLDQPLTVNGKVIESKGHITDVLTRQAVDWINREHKSPFCLYLSHKASHEPFTTTERHADLYKGATFPLPPSAKYNMEGKPEWLKNSSPLGKGEKYPKDIEIFYRSKANYNRSLVAVDEGIGQILDALKAKGELDNTVIVFCGDNGFFHGEHGLADKRKAYEESIRIPFLIRYPKMVKPGQVLNEMVLNIDLAPTLLDIAGVSVPAAMQGRSIKPLLEGRKTEWREDFLYEYKLEQRFPQTPTMHSVRTERWKYIEYPEIKDTAELYDLKSDPYEMKNLINDPSKADTVKEMKKRLARLLKETNAR